MLDYNSIVQTISSISDLPGFIASEEKIDIVRTGFLSTSSLGPIYSIMFQRRVSFQSDRTGKKPTLLRTINRFGLSFLCVVLYTDPSVTLLFGPFFLEHKDAESIARELCIMEPDKISKEDADLIVNLIPIKDSAFVQAWAQVVVRFFGMQQSSYIKVNTIDLFEREMEEVSTISENRINEANISSHYAYEKELHSLMRNGDKVKLKKLLVPSDTRTATLALQHSVFEERVVGRNSLRAEMNLLITLNVMFRQAAFDSGLPPLYVHSISEDIVNRIEKATNREELITLIDKMIDSYCNSINNISYQNHSVNVVKVQKYIINNKSEKITLDKLCGLTGLDESYLCRLFKRECHMTINEYIQIQRTNEAKWILASSDTPIIEIANMLGYSSQSYFCSVFKKTVGVSPSAYRMNRGKYYKPESN